MAIIQELHLFSWKTFHEDIVTLGDLERFKLVIETIPDSELMETLHHLRGHGRNDHPIRALWNSVLAGIVFEHIGIQSLTRELRRNAQLRELCGFDPIKGVGAVPSKSSYNRFLTALLKQEALVRKMFDSLVSELMTLAADFGKNIAGDGKAIDSLGRPSKKSKGDKRRENDADWGVKKYAGTDENGKAWEKVKSWFGFRLHLIVDADAELPVSYEITQASKNEQPVMRGMLVKLNETHPVLIQRCENGMFDKGYDSAETVVGLWKIYKIKPIIDIRNMWRDGEPTRLLRTKNIKNVTYDFKGTVFCHCPETGEIKRMAYGGFEQSRETLKYICPVLHYGTSCKGAAQCLLFMKSIRISLKEDPRIFTPLPRSSYKWEALYKKRTSVERVNSRIDVSFGFERHYIRGLKKMELRCGLALTVMLSIAVGRLRQERPELMRSLVRTA